MFGVSDIAQAFQFGPRPAAGKLLPHLRVPSHGSNALRFTMRPRCAIRAIVLHQAQQLN